MPATPDLSAATTAGDASTDSTAADGVAAVGDDAHDSKEVVLRRYFLQEWELVSAILGRIVAAGGVAEPADVHRIRSIVSSLSPPLLLDFNCRKTIDPY
jgi:hypothetical protein